MTPAPALKRASRNIKGVSYKEAAKINARDVLLRENLVVEKEALEQIIKRVK